MAGQGVAYAVDIVMCIDATGSMGDLIDKVKRGALKLYQDLGSKMSEKSKTIDTLRVKVVVYRDYYCDGDQAMAVSEFFNLPDEKEKFHNFVEKIDADGGGDEPENGLEALALAIKSDWTSSGDKRRHMIVLWTDASSHKLDKSGKPAGYPSGMPKDFDEITDWWEANGYVNQSAKRLILFAPDAYPWTDISTNWNNSIHYPSAAGEGLSEVDYSEILDAIANSV